MKKITYVISVCGLILLLIGVLSLLGSKLALADPHSGQSVNVVIIGGATLDTSVYCSWNYAAANVMGYTGGGCLPVTGLSGELGDFTFTPMGPPAMNATSLAPFDTAVLNVASSAMACNTNILTASQKSDLIAFVQGGKKLIIFDSECYPGPVDYSWLPFPFTTANPGAMGAQGLLTIVEENTLSSNDPADPHFIDAVDLSYNTDAVGDMNVMTTYDPNWCVDMSGTNFLGVTGPVHTYAKIPSGTDNGLIIYNGLDQDYQWYGDQNLRKVWLQELQQPFNPSGLPCGITVVGITLDPQSASNKVGETHTVTAKLTDLLGNPQEGILVTFEILSGPNTGATGTCSPNSDCTTDAGGQVSFAYSGIGGMGIDEIRACFTNQAGQVICSQVVTKEWTEQIHGRMTGGGSVFTSNGLRVTHGFELNCELTKGPNNLQVNWGNGNKFHLESLITASCTDDPSIEPNPPVAGFDTLKGVGTGRYNGISGAIAEWTFTDAGEPGNKDFAKILIKDAGGNIILDVSGTLNRGNQQAHKE